MSTNGHDHNQDHGNQLVEGSGIKPKPILVFLAVLGLATASVFVIIKGLEIGFKKMDEMTAPQPATSLETGRKLPPAPRLQGAPEPDPNKPNDPNAVRESLLPLDEMRVYSKQIKEKAESYGWVDQNGGVAHIPIEQAKKLVVEKGLPLLSDSLIGEYEAAEKARMLVLNAGSSSGRGIKSQKPAGAAPASAVPESATPAASQTAQPTSGEKKPDTEAGAKAQGAAGGKN